MRWVREAGVVATRARVDEVQQCPAHDEQLPTAASDVSRSPTPARQHSCGDGRDAACQPQDLHEDEVLHAASSESPAT